MIEKLFRLNPQSSWDLEELSSSFEEGPATVKKIADFYWLILEFDSEKSDQEVLAEARTTLARMSPNFSALRSVPSVGLRYNSLYCSDLLKCF